MSTTVSEKAKVAADAQKDVLIKKIMLLRDELRKLIAETKRLQNQASRKKKQSEK